jgi:hypothetical protein
MATIKVIPNHIDVKNAEFLQCPFLHTGSHVNFISPSDVSDGDVIHDHILGYPLPINYYEVLSCERLNALPYGVNWYCYKINVRRTTQHA